MKKSTDTAKKAMGLEEVANTDLASVVGGETDTETGTETGNDVDGTTSTETGDETGDETTP